MRQSPGRLSIPLAWKLAAAILLLAIFIAGSSLSSPRGSAQTPPPSTYRAGNVHITLPQVASRQAQLAPFAGAAPASVTNMTYNGGSIQQTPIVYTIFWNPHGTISPGYESLINRYFQDIGGSDFYNVVTQYYQLPGPVYMQNLSSLGGTFVDSAPYPGGRGTTTRPISDQDIENEVTRALSLNPSWPTPSIGSEYFVYTEPGIESCYDPSAPHSDLSCTPGIASPYGYCAYHSAFGTISQPVIYANMPYDETWTTSCRTFSQSPNGNLAADSDISTSSHEHFEIANDPLLDAWYDPSGAEIGDKCAYRYGTTQADGRNLTLNGNPYIIQLEWSNANNDGVTPYSGCVSSYGGATVTPSPTASSTPSPTPTPTPTPTASPTPTPTASPTPTPTPSPTPTPTASPTPTPTPVPTPSPTPLDSDADGVPDASDNCPNWPNQAQNLPVWPVPPGDSDCDGFPDRVAIGAPNPLAAEAFTGTDPASHCASTSARNDEPLPDRWPVDLDDNQLVNGQDLLQFSPVFAAIAPDPRYNVRFDLNEDGRINGADLLKFSPFFVKHCA